MAKTLAQIEAIVSRLCDDYVSGTTSAAGNAGGTTVVTTSEDVMTRPGQSWVPHILEITSGTYDNQVRQVSDFTVSAGVGTLTVVNAFGGQIAISVTFRLHRIPPSWKKQAIDDALRSFSSVAPLVLSKT